MTKFILESGGDVAAALNPMNRVGTPSDMGGTLLYLVSRAGAWTNGAIIPLDGGAHLFEKPMGT